MSDPEDNSDNNDNGDNDHGFNDIEDNSDSNNNGDNDHGFNDIEDKETIDDTKDSDNTKDSDESDKESRNSDNYEKSDDDIWENANAACLRIYDESLPDKQSESDIEHYYCEHIYNNYKIRCWKCDEYYDCLKCHNNQTDHIIKNIEEIICKSCNTIQDFSKRCMKCGISFGDYICDICSIGAESKNKEKINIYHCDKCKTCIYGSKDDFTHCDICKCCIYNSKIQHKCRNDRLLDICPICQTSFNEDVAEVDVVKCGHTLHYQCYLQYAKYSRKCPICRDNMH